MQLLETLEYIYVTSGSIASPHINNLFLLPFSDVLCNLSSRIFIINVKKLKNNVYSA